MRLAKPKFVQICPVEGLGHGRTRLYALDENGDVWAFRPGLRLKDPWRWIQLSAERAVGAIFMVETDNSDTRLAPTRRVKRAKRNKART